MGFKHVTTPKRHASTEAHQVASSQIAIRESASPPAAPFNSTSFQIRQQNLRQEEAGSSSSLDDVKEISTMAAAADPITDQSLCPAAEIPRICPRADCPAPHDIELKYLANRAAAGFTQPRYVCHGCKRDFALAGCKPRGTTEPMIWSDSTTKSESRGDDAMLAAIQPEEAIAATESVVVESTLAAASPETRAELKESLMQNAIDHEQVARRPDQRQLLKLSN